MKFKWLTLLVLLTCLLAFNGTCIAKTKEVDRARVLIDNKAYSKAVTALTEVIQKEPQNKEAYYQMCRAVGSAGLYDDAIVFAEKAIKIDPKYAEPYNCIGYLYALKLKDIDSGLIYIEKAIAVDPHYFRAYANKAEIMKIKKEYQKAINIYSKMLGKSFKASNSDRGKTYYQRGLLWYKLRKYDKALNDLKQSAKLYPTITNIRKYKTVLLDLEMKTN